MDQLRPTRIATATLIALAACGAPEPRPPAQAPRPSIVMADDICAQIVGAAPAIPPEEGWSIVTRDALSAADRESWNTYHPVECPGMAELDLNGDGRAEFAATLVRSGDDGLAQKMLLLRRRSDGGYDAQTVWGPEPVPSARVVYISSVPSEHDPDSGLPLQYDAFILEQLETSPIAFYEVEGALRTLTWTHRANLPPREP